MTAAQKLEPVTTILDDEEDGPLYSFDDAPISDEPYTDEMRAADEIGLADIHAGRCRTISREEMQAKLDRLRREQGG